MKIEKAYDHIMRLSNNYNIMTLWLKSKYELGKDIDDYLFELGKKNVAVYGMGKIGECLIACLSKSKKVSLICGIDKNPLGCYEAGVQIIGIDHIPDGIDVVVVSILDSFFEIKKELLKYKSVNIVSLEEIVYKMSIED